MILVVDDERVIRELLQSLLEDESYRVKLAIHGAHALDVIRQERPDLIISDVMMPVLDGKELCRQLKADPATRSIPIILMSAAGTRDLEHAGAEAFFAKPFRTNEVVDLVAAWIPAIQRKGFASRDLMLRALVGATSPATRDGVDRNEILKGGTRGDDGCGARIRTSAT